MVSTHKLWKWQKGLSLTLMHVDTFLPSSQCDFGLLNWERRHDENFNIIAEGTSIVAMFMCTESKGPLDVVVNLRCDKISFTSIVSRFSVSEQTKAPRIEQKWRRKFLTSSSKNKIYGRKEENHSISLLLLLAVITSLLFAPITFQPFQLH